MAQDEQSLIPRRREKASPVPAKLPLCHLVLHSPDTASCSVTPKIYIAQNGGVPPEKHFLAFKTDKLLMYDAFCDDFGPMNILCVVRFVEMLDKIIAKSVASCKYQAIVYRVEDGPRALTNAAFLLGAHMIMKLDQTPRSVLDAFCGANSERFEEYRDATYFTPDFRLRLIDCWEGLARAKQLGWFTCPSSPSSSQWGLMDASMYEHYDNPLNADLHEVVPGKFVAFKGPRDLGGKTYVNNPKSGNRDFSPGYFVDIFRSLGVSTVIRINKPQYNAATFTDNGIQHHDLCFEECTVPPPAVVARFFEIVDSAPGRIAVHCKGGLGRTATLIALYLMRTHGFTAREGIAWLRIMRPGSVIGVEQHFLCGVEESLARMIVSPTPDRARTNGKPSGMLQNN